jgi:hypothetical protein
LTFVTTSVTLRFPLRKGVSLVATKKCKTCKQPVPRVEMGRPSIYCSRACRQKAYRRRVAKDPHRVVLGLLNNDLFAIRNRTARRDGAVKVLEELGYAVTLAQGKSNVPPKPKPSLRLVPPVEGKAQPT